MPYIGAKIRRNDELVTVKVYGTDELFHNEANVRELISSAVAVASRFENPTVGLAKEIANSFEGNEDALWVECEILNADGSLSGDTELITLVDA